MEKPNVPGRGELDESREQIVDEHRQLRELLARIEVAESPRAMLPLLEKLRLLLKEHFEHEEAEGGMPGMVADSAPQLIRELDDLMHEHHAFLADVEKLVASAERGDDAKALRAEFRDLASRLHDHESRETDLIIDAFESDLGGGD